MLWKYSKQDLQKELWISYNILQKIIIAEWSNLPITPNVLDSRKIYTGETIKYIKEKYKL